MKAMLLTWVKKIYGGSFNNACSLLYTETLGLEPLEYV